MTSELSISTYECPLCGVESAHLYHQRMVRNYYKCPQCCLIFVARDQLPTIDRERQEYDLHNNDPEDEGYRRWLSSLTTTLIPYLKFGAKGLDFGCGPGPALSQIMQEQGFVMDNYDPIYFPVTSILNEACMFDFITCTEAAEHFHTPASEFFNIFPRILKPGGILAVMTGMAVDGKFANWHYIRDETHVSFYSEATMQWIGQQNGWEVEFHPKNVTIFKSRGGI